MQKDTKQDESVSAEIQDVMRTLIAAIRVVKIYPPNNPIYSQSVKKSCEALIHFLENSPEYLVRVNKTFFTYQSTPIGKETQLNKALAQDLFAKGIRELIFSSQLTEAELMELYRSLALSPEDLAMKSGISSILWEKGVTHIKVTEAGLDEVITTKSESDWVEKTTPEAAAGLESSKAKKEMAFTGRTLVLGDMMADPEGFGAKMMELAKQTRAEHETIEDRLFTLYQEAGQKISKENPAESDALFESLAKSALSLEKPHREGLIAGKLYGDLDADIAAEGDAEQEQNLPNAFHEIQTGRFSNSWNVEQVAVLLKRSASKKIAPATPPPAADKIESVPLPKDLTAIARELEEYTPEQLEALKLLSEAGMESDIIEAAVRTLIYLIPLVKNPLVAGSTEKEIGLFSGVIHQLEDMLSYVLKNNNYELATLIIKTLHMPVDPQFKPRMEAALKKTATKTIVMGMINDMRKHSRESAEYHAARTYLLALDRKATEVLLDLLSEEKDRNARIFLLDLLKDFGKDQLTLLGEHLSDDRWYVVRNIVTILGESKTEQALALLRKVVDHKHIQIRQEVIKALAAIGGKKAAGLLAKYLRDPEVDIQVMAINIYADFPGIGAEEAIPLLEFLDERALSRKEHELTLGVIKALGKIGGRDAGAYLERYNHIRWWKPRKLQGELRDEAVRAQQEIARRQGNAGRAKR